ncbi:hypothetical protein, partial [Klebsiella pneumoniae]
IGNPADKINVLVHKNKKPALQAFSPSGAYLQHLHHSDGSSLQGGFTYPISSGDAIDKVQDHGLHHNFCGDR